MTNSAFPGLRITYRVCCTLGIAAFVLLSVLGSFDSYRKLEFDSWTNPDRSRVNMYTDRFREAARLLPPIAVVGYFSDHPPNWTPIPSPPYDIRYALAPRLLAYYPDPVITDWVIGDFSEPQNLAALEKSQRLTLVKDFGNGVILFHK